MIEDMRKLAQGFQAAASGDLSSGLDEQKRELCNLCERHTAGTPVYVLYPKSSGVTALRMQEMQEDQSWRAPFVKVGPRAGYLVPVFKVERLSGGKESKRESTLLHFHKVAESKNPAAGYFAAACAVLEARQFISASGEGKPQEVAQAYASAIAEIVRRSKAGTAKKGSPPLPGQNHLISPRMR